MKTLHQLLVLSVAIITLASCSETKQNNAPVQNQDMSGMVQQQTPIQNTNFQQNQPNKQPKLVMKYFKDSNGNKSHRMPLPQDWKVNPNFKDSIKIKGPNGIVVAKMPTLYFAYSEDTELHKGLKEEGFELYPFTTIDELAPHLTAAMKENGFSDINNYELPAYTQRMQKESNKLDVAGGTVTSYAKVYELKGPKTEDAVIVIAQNKMSIETVNIWTVGFSVLKTPKESFETARDTYLFALNNIEVNPKRAEEFNQAFSEEFQKGTGK